MVIYIPCQKLGHRKHSHVAHEASCKPGDGFQSRQWTGQKKLDMFLQMGWPHLGMAHN